MVAIILLWILNRRHAMNSRRALEMNPFIRMPRRTWMFLENTPGGAVIRVRVAWLKRRREALSTGTGCGRRDGGARRARRLERERRASILRSRDAEGELWFGGASGVHCRDEID